MGLVPDWSITADDKDITDKIKSRLVSLSVKDSTGSGSDTFELELADTEPVIDLPKMGVALTLLMGYKNDLAFLGKYNIDEINLSTDPRRMTIHAKATNFYRSMKAKKTRKWSHTGTTPAPIALTDIINSIANEHRLIPSIGADYQGVMYPLVNQTNESDLHLLKRMSSALGATVKTANDHLVFVKKGRGKTATGKVIPDIELTPLDVAAVSVSVSERGHYKSVAAKYHSPSTAKTVSVIVGSGAPVYSLSNVYKDEAEATNAAQAKLSALQRGGSKVDIDLMGRADLLAGGVIKMTGFRDGIDGNWSITDVTRRLDERGYRCQVKGEVKG